ncbi:MAG: methyltransferase domain-containing protein [Geminicoccaceae bacterium]
MTDPMTRLRCSHCRKGGLRPDPEAECLICDDCGGAHAIEDGVAVLVANAAHHLAELDQARTANPGWYAEAQPPETDSPWRHHLKKRRRYVEQALMAELDRRGQRRVPSVLDLGCGDGNHLGWLARFAEEIYGCDYNLLRLSRARARHRQATLFLADILDFPAFDHVFDVIFFNHVIEHIQDDVAALKTVRRLLAPDGLLVLGTPNEGAWWWQHAYKRDPASLKTTDHVHFYTAASLTERMGAAGLKADVVHHMGWGPPDWHLDGRIRGYKIVDDLFELVGKACLRNQASSLYVLARAA